MKSSTNYIIISPLQLLVFLVTDTSLSWPDLSFFHPGSGSFYLACGFITSRQSIMAYLWPWLL